MKLEIEIPEADAMLKQIGWKIDFSFLEKLQKAIHDEDVGRIELEQCEAAILALYQMQVEGNHE